MKAIVNSGRLLGVLVCAAFLAAAPRCVRAFVIARNPRTSNLRPSGTVHNPMPPLPTPQERGIPYDWSHRHVIFSRPSTPAMVRRFEQQPRYQMQRRWRHRQAVAGSVEDYMQTLDALAVRLATRRTLPVLPKLKWGIPLPVKKKLPVGAWGESLDVLVSNSNGNANYPAKFAFTDGTSCSDWVAFTAPNSSPSAFNLFAFSNLYSSVCSPTPKLLFTYNPSTASGAMRTGPAISSTGTQVALVEKGPTAFFHVVRFASVGSAPTFPTPSSLPICSNSSTPPPCQYLLNYSTQASATLSAPFYHYTAGQDIAYISDDNGNTFAINPVFGGNLPAIRWTIALNTINSATTMTAPVYDGVSHNVFVGDQQGFLYYIRTQSTSPGTCGGGSPPCLGITNTSCTASGTPFSCCTGAGTGTCKFLKVSSKPIIEPVIVDSNTGKVFVFSNGNPNGLSAGSYVVQTDVTLSSINAASIGSGTTNVIHAGAFDDNYFTSPSTGRLYVCGQNSSSRSPSSMPSDSTVRAL